MAAAIARSIWASVMGDFALDAMLTGAPSPSQGTVRSHRGIYSLFYLIIAAFLRYPGLAEAVGTGSLTVLAELVREMSVEQGRMPSEEREYTFAWAGGRSRTWVTCRRSSRTG